MGKLHSLRREIERSPENFIMSNEFSSTRWSIGAIKSGKKWHPIRASSYYRFVNKVLRQLGYNVKTW